MVGEIRDKETAEIAIQASLTGHLVFSTVHTNDAAGAVTRLVEMGIEPFLVASSLTAILAQRLVRQVCRDCRVAYTPTDDELAKLGMTRERFKAFGGGTVYKANGCAQCNQNGYRGRTGIYELLLVDDDVRQLVSQERRQLGHHQEEGDGKRHAHSARRRRAQGGGRRDDHRRGALGHAGGLVTRHGRLRIQRPQRRREERHRAQGSRKPEDVARGAAQRRRLPHRRVG